MPNRDLEGATISQSDTTGSEPLRPKTDPLFDNNDDVSLIFESPLRELSPSSSSSMINSHASLGDPFADISRLQEHLARLENQVAENKLQIAADRLQIQTLNDKNAELERKLSEMKESLAEFKNDKSEDQNEKRLEDKLPEMSHDFFNGTSTHQTPDDENDRVGRLIKVPPMDYTSSRSIKRKKCTFGSIILCNDRVT